MKHLLLPLSLITCSTMAAVAAPYGVKGTVRDAMTAETLPGATCALYHANDSIKPVISAMAGADGTFNIDLKTAGNYLLKITMVGQKPVSRNFAVTTAKPVADLGTIAMQTDGGALEEVVVTGRRPVIEASGDKVSYNLTEDPTTQTSTVLEMLRKVPMVTVDAQDNILVNGQSSFKIYLNGKEDPMLSQNASTVLKSLPAVAIKRIEVILDPGAKYDAEGVGGILNIITETQASTDGQMATITVGGGANNASASVYGMAKKNKVTASVDVSYYNNLGNRTNTGNMYRETRNTENPTIVDQQIRMKQRNQFVNGNARLSWEPDASNLFTLSASSYGGWGNHKYNTISNTFSKNNPGNGISSKQDLKSKWVWTSLTLNAGYQHNFDDKGHNMVLSYQYVHGWNTNKDHTFTSESSLPDYIPCVYNYTNSPTNEHTAQLDYTKPFATWFTLEAGAKGIFRRNSSDGYTKNGNDWDNLVMADFNNVKMKQNQDVAAAYATYAGSFGKFGLRAGLRYEYTHMMVKFRTPGYDNFSANLNDWVPNASLSYSITPTQNLYASYQQRIRRPSVDELNPHSSEYIAGFIQKGNPDLTSEKSHTVALSYSNFAGKLGINFRTYYTFSNNSISQYSYAEGSSFVTTYNNVGNQRDWGLSGFMKYQVNALMDFSVNAGVQYRHLRFRAQKMENSGWTMNFGANYNYSMPWNLKLNAYGGFSTRRFELQGHMSGFNYHGLSLSKAFLKGDKIKVTLSGNNFASPHMTFKVYNYGKDYANTMKVRVPTWDVSLSVAVTLGGLNTTVKKTATQIHNDDVEQSKGGGGALGN